MALGRRIGAGGEGLVYEVAGRVNYVAKLYDRPPDQNKRDKLIRMAGAYSDDLANVAAWPVATLHGHPGGSVIGVVLPRVAKAVEIHELYSPAHRRIHFPDADWRFLVRAATNCAIAFSALHSKGIVIGDVNQGNVFVSYRALVRFIDCDSFQFRRNGALYLCEVGVPHFTPPELHGVDFRSVERTANHDCFGLAVLLFHLLFMGRHPFAGRFAGSGDMPIERAIREHRFAYTRAGHARGMSPPPQSLPMEAVSRELVDLFERAFSESAHISNSRPSADQWAKWLTEFEKHLRVCPQNRGHVYFARLAECPWCQIELGGGPYFFVTVTIKATLGARPTFNISLIWREIENVSFPELSMPQTVWPQNARVLHRPLPADLEWSTTFERIVGALALGGLAALVAGTIVPIVALFGAGFLLCFGIWWVALRASSPIAKLSSERKRILRYKASELARAMENWRSVMTQRRVRFDSRLQSLRQSKEQYQNLSRIHAEELRQLRASAEKKQRDEFLRRHFLSTASVANVGEGRRATLAAYGIETAYDVEWNRVFRIPGFGAVLTSNLIGWRHGIDRKFRFDPAKGVPQADIQALQYRHYQEQRQIELQLQTGPRDLDSIALAATRESDSMQRLIGQLDFEVTQAKADVNACRRGIR